MKVLNLANADVAISGDVDFGSQSLVADVTFAYDNDPSELDMPSGAWWLWPLRRGSLRISGVLEPGGALPAITETLAASVKDVTVTSAGINGIVHTVPFNGIYLTGIDLGIQQVGEAMPALRQTLEFTVFKDDNGDSGDYTPT